MVRRDEGKAVGFGGQGLQSRSTGTVFKGKALGEHYWRYIHRNDKLRFVSENSDGKKQEETHIASHTLSEPITQAPTMSCPPSTCTSKRPGSVLP